MTTTQPSTHATVHLADDGRWVHEIHIGHDVVAVHRSHRRHTHVLIARDWSGQVAPVSWHSSAAGARAERRRHERHLRPLVDPRVLEVVA